MKKVTKTLLPIIGIIILALGLFNILDSDVALSIAVSISGLSSILKGYYLYVKEKNKKSRSLILGGIVLIIVSILALLFRKL